MTSIQKIIESAPLAEAKNVLVPASPADIPVQAKSSSPRKTVSQKTIVNKIVTKATEEKPAVKKPSVKKSLPSKPVTKAALSTAVIPAKAKKPAEPQKTRKPKLVRDSFTIPKAEYAVLEELKQRAALLTRPIKKSELLRAGIKLLASLPDADFLTALAKVPTIKTGRPVLEK